MDPFYARATYLGITTDRNTQNDSNRMDLLGGFTCLEGCCKAQTLVAAW